jgi:hypothetical protein
MRLPKWVVDNESSLGEEAAPYVSLIVEDDELGKIAAAPSALGIAGDIERLRHENGARGMMVVQLAAAYVRRELAAMMGEDDERVLRWDQLAQKTALP